MMPLFCKKSQKLRPRDVPRMMLGGSPVMVAAPPRLAAKISPMMRGTGSKRRYCASRTVAATRKRITVTLSTNMASSAARIIKLIKMAMGRKPRARARRRLTQSKKPASPMPSTSTIMPVRKNIVLQLMPTFSSVTPPWANQNRGVRKLCRLKASSTAGGWVSSSTTSIQHPAHRETR